MQISTDAMSSSSSFADSDSTCSMLTPSLEFPDRISFRKIDLSEPGPSGTKPLRCRGIAANLVTMIENVQPAVNEILYSSVEVSEDRQVQLRMFSETLDKCKKLTDKALKCNRWNMVRQLYHVKKMEDLEKKISKFVQTLPLHILADVHHRRVDVEVRLDRIDRACDSLNEKIDSMKIRGSESMREALKTAETTMEMVTDGDLGNLGVGLELGKRKVKDMLFESNDEACSFTTNEGDSSRIVSNTWPIYASGGSIITSWQKGQLLGRGSFGSVYERISEDGDFLAVNEGSLLDQESHVQECIQQLKAEIALLSQLQGQNIISSSSSSVDSDSTCSFITPSLEFPDRISFRKMDLSEAGPSGTKALRCRGIAANLVTMIENVQPAINEILYSGVEVSGHRQVQLRMISETLDKCKKLTDKVLKCPRWNMVRQLYHVKKMEDLEKKISTFIDGLSLHVLADVHHLRADTEVRLDRIDRHCDSLNEKLGSMKIRGSESMREALKTAETTMEMVSDGDLGNLGVGLELRKRKVKDMLFESNDEARLIGISGMSGSGKTTLAREIESDQEVRGHFGNRVLFLIVSQSPNVEELRSLIWGFLSGYDASFGATSGDQTRKLVILDDVWTRESLDQLFVNIPGTTTLVVSRSNLAGPRKTYDIELLNENEATSLFCLSAFDQKSVPLGFSRSLVKQVVGECKGLPLSLKVVGASLKNQPEKYWEGAATRLSRGEPANETHESRVFAQIEATQENLDPKTREFTSGVDNLDFKKLSCSSVVVVDSNSTNQEITELMPPVRRRDKTPATQIYNDAVSSSSSFADSDSTCSMMTPSLEFPDRISVREMDLSEAGPSGVIVTSNSTNRVITKLMPPVPRGD